MTVLHNIELFLTIIGTYQDRDYPLKGHLKPNMEHHDQVKPTFYYFQDEEIIMHIKQKLPVDKKLVNKT